MSRGSGDGIRTLSSSFVSQLGFPVLVALFFKIVSSIDV